MSFVTFVCSENVRFLSSTVYLNQGKTAFPVMFFIKYCSVVVDNVITHKIIKTFRYVRNETHLCCGKRVKTPKRPSQLNCVHDKDITHNLEWLIFLSPAGNLWGHAYRECPQHVRSIIISNEKLFTKSEWWLACAINHHVIFGCYILMLELFALALW